jgi:hypothetical protein
LNNHLFILSPNLWVGEGRIQINMLQEELFFHTKWEASSRNKLGRIRCTQEIHIQGLSDITYNNFSFFDLSQGSFFLELKNPSIGKIQGKGLVTEDIIAWEFRDPLTDFEGFEFYEKQKDASYLIHAQYATKDQLQTTIKGKIWQNL